LQEHDQVFFWEEDATAKDDHSRLPSDRLVERVETGGRQHEPAHVWQHGKQVYSQTDSGLLSEPHQEGLKSLVGVLVLIAVCSLRWVHLQIGMVYGPQLVRVLSFVLLVVCLVDPGERVHEHVVECGRDVAHESHQEEGYLQDGMLDEVYALNHVGVPCDFGEVDEEAKELNQNADAGGLENSLEAEMMSLEGSSQRHTGMATSSLMTMPASTANAACL
jgi:hypothetical protein